MQTLSMLERVVLRDAKRVRQPVRNDSLQLADIHPVIHVAHRMRSPLRILQRQIVDHELVLFIAGSGQVMIDGQHYPVTPHSLFFIPPFVRNAFSCPSDCEHIAVHFDWATNFPTEISRLQQRAPYRVRLPRGIQIAPASALSRGHRIESLFIEILRLRAQGRPWSELEAANRLTDVLIELMRLRQDRQASAPRDPEPRISPAVHHQKMQRALNLMREQLSEPLKIAELSHAAALSPAHFRRLFHQWTGYPPLEYLRRLRMEKARKLLGDVDLSIKQIALKVGYDDPYHFSRSFRQIDGRSPTEFRNMALSDLNP